MNAATPLGAWGRLCNVPLTGQVHRQRPVPKGSGPRRAQWGCAMPCSTQRPHSPQWGCAPCRVLRAPHAPSGKDCAMPCSKSCPTPPVGLRHAVVRRVAPRPQWGCAVPCLIERPTRPVGLRHAVFKELPHAPSGVAPRRVQLSALTPPVAVAPCRGFSEPPHAPSGVAPCRVQTERLHARRSGAPAPCRAQRACARVPSCPHARGRVQRALRVVARRNLRRFWRSQIVFQWHTWHF